MPRRRMFSQTLGGPTISQGVREESERRMRRHKWDEFHDANPGGIDLEWLREHYEGKAIPVEPVMSQELFDASIAKLRALGAHEQVFMQALELGRALAMRELNVFEVFAVWCGREPWSLDPPTEEES